MDPIATIMTWIMTTSYGPYVVAALTALGGMLTIASAIVPLTKTPKDDEALATLKALLARFSLFPPKQ